MSDRAALVEKMARAMCREDASDPSDPYCVGYYLPKAAAALDIALEEAAARIEQLEAALKEAERKIEGMYEDLAGESI